MSANTPNTHAKAVKQHTQDIWLAGLGAYATQHGNIPTSFSELIEAGKGYEAEIAANAYNDESKLDELKARANQTLDKIERVFDERVSGAMKRLGMSSRSDIEGLNQRVDDLAASVEALLKCYSDTQPD